MRLSMYLVGLLALSIDASFQTGSVFSLRRAASSHVLLDVTAGNDDEPSDGVKITIRKGSGEELSPEYRERLRVEQEAAEANADRLARLLADEEWAVCVVSFAHVKTSLATFLKFWLMGGCGVRGWSGTGELEAKHTSGTCASIQIDSEQATVSLLTTSDKSYNSKVQLQRYAKAMLDELQNIASAEDVEADNRLCYPPEAIDTARASLPPPRPPRNPTTA